MNPLRAAAVLLLLLPSASGARRAPPPEPSAAIDHALPGEHRLRNVRKLTSGGENAEAYWSWDSKRLVFQARRGDRTCDDIRVMRADGSDQRIIASAGAHTCAFFLPGDRRLLFASTSTGGDACPSPPDRSQGYVWPLHPDYDIYTVRPDGSARRRITTTPGYDAEATVNRWGRIVFTSVRDGDLEIYTMRADGSDVRRLTTRPGYDGGAVWSPDGRSIVFRARQPDGAPELEDYRRLLAMGLVRPGRLDIWLMDADGGNQRQLTHLEGASFAPCFTPDGRSILFSSNHGDPKGRNFDLYLVSIAGGPAQRVTHDPSFDGFPLFSPDGKRLAFCSNRSQETEGETNVFVADWVP